MAEKTGRRPEAVGTAANQRNSTAPNASKTSHDNQPPRRDPNDVQSRWLREAVGRQIRARLLDGKAISGKLLAFDQFSLLIQTSADTPSLLYKQFIGYLTLDAQGDPG